MSNYPLSIRTLTKKARLLQVSVKADWQSMYNSMQGQERAEADLKHQLCQELSREFTRAAFENCYFKRQEGAEGVTYKLEAYALTYDELMMLMYQAYCEGQTERGNISHLLKEATFLPKQKENNHERMDNTPPADGG